MATGERGYSPAAVDRIDAATTGPPDGLGAGPPQPTEERDQ